jgi:hypothetical protein
MEEAMKTEIQRSRSERHLISGSDARIIIGHDRAAPLGLQRQKDGAAFAGKDLRPMPLSPCAIDVEDRADHLEEVLGAVSGYVAAILDDVAQNVPGGLDRRQIDALLSDLISEVTGTLRQAADALPLPGRRP